MNLAKNTVSFDGEGFRLDTSEDAEVICNQLEGKDVEVLILQGNTFGIEAAERVGIELSKQPNLREAHFKDLFTSRGRDEVPEALKHLLSGISNSGAQLTLLDLSDNAIGPIGAPSLIEFLESPAAETIEKLYLNNCGLGPEGSTSIAVSIPRLRKLKEFIVGRNRLENKGATNMSRALSELKHLEILKLPQNGIRVEGIKKLVEVLRSSLSTIREFDLSDNTIKAEGSKALADVLTRATNLRTILLNDSLLENDGFTLICEALSKSPSLNQLDEASFEGNEIYGHKIVDLIESTFNSCQRTFTLNLLENEFAPGELARLDCLKEKIDIILDDIDSDDEEEEEEDDDDETEDGEEDGQNVRYSNGIEEGEIENDSDGSGGYVDITGIDTELREVSRDFIKSFQSVPYNEAEVNSAFIQLISTGVKPSGGEKDYQTVQILCEELGLIKCEQTRKTKELARDAIVYIGKRLNELPETSREFFEAVVKNNDELGCGKLLFAKLDI